jgi:hypothetical protein
MNHTDLEIKLIRHALDTNSEGEARNAAAMFFKELRKRGIKAHEFLETGGATPAAKSPNTGMPGFNYNGLKPDFDYKFAYALLSEQLRQAEGKIGAADSEARFQAQRAREAGVAEICAKSALARCQEELKIARQELAQLRRKESSLWSGLVRSVTG